MNPEARDRKIAGFGAQRASGSSRGGVSCGRNHSTKATMHNPARQTNVLAILSLIFGILGWSLLPLIGSIAAIVTGHMARGQIRREPERYDGDGLAIAGLVMGWGSIILGILTVVVIVLFFGGLAAILAFAGQH